MKTWEYKVVFSQSESENFFNMLGMAGWELVAVTPSPQNPGNDVQFFNFYFKREKAY